MSEQCSLYVKICIREEKLQEFFRAEPVTQGVDENWSAWWDSRLMYSKQTVPAIPHYRIRNNRAVFDELLGTREFFSTEHYDKEAQSWTFITVFFSENYTEILPMLASLKTLATYQDTTDDGVAFIYDFWWGSQQVMAYMEFSGQQAQLRNYTSSAEISDSVLEQADSALQEAADRLSKQFED